MRNNNHQTKHPRGSSPPLQEMKRELNDWVIRLPSIKPFKIGTKMEEDKKAVADGILECVLQAANAGRWRDDRGEGG
jgi:hypothetical protein